MATIEPDDVDESFIPVPAPDIAWVDLDGEVVLYDEGTQRLHLLNAIASVVWHGLDRRVTLGELIDDLSEAYGADRAEVARDVVELSRDLGRSGALLGVSTSEPAGDG